MNTISQIGAVPSAKAADLSTGAQQDAGTTSQPFSDSLNAATSVLNAPDHSQSAAAKPASESDQKKADSTSTKKTKPDSDSSSEDSRPQAAQVSQDLAQVVMAPVVESQPATTQDSAKSTDEATSAVANLAGQASSKAVPQDSVKSTDETASATTNLAGQASFKSALHDSASTAVEDLLANGQKTTSQPANVPATGDQGNTNQTAAGEAGAIATAQAAVSKAMSEIGAKLSQGANGSQDGKTSAAAAQTGLQAPLSNAPAQSTAADTAAAPASAAALADSIASQLAAITGNKISSDDQISALHASLGTKGVPLFAKAGSTVATKPAAAATDTTSTGTAGTTQHAQKTDGDSQQSSASGDQNQTPSGAGSDKPSAAQADKSLASDAAAAMSQLHSVATQATRDAGTSVPSADSRQSAGQAADMGAAKDAAALPEQNTVINTAKLIQTASQSELRVGMTSSEFGNISISTSSTRDMVTAQIQVDHTELAKTITAQLSDFQSKFGGTQMMDVRVDMHGTGMAAGQGSGSQGGMMDSSSNPSYNGGQQSHATSGTYGSTGDAERQLPAAVLSAQTAAGSNALNGRLDVTA